MNIKCHFYGSGCGNLQTISIRYVTIILIYLSHICIPYFYNIWHIYDFIKLGNCFPIFLPSDQIRFDVRNKIILSFICVLYFLISFFHSHLLLFFLIKVLDFKRLLNRRGPQVVMFPCKMKRPEWRILYKVLLLV